MRYNNYEIELYRPDYISGVSDVQKYLYGLGREATAEYFHWKYEENPYADEPLGIVAVYKGKIIGYRGYFVTKWEIGNKDITALILSSSDVIVRPDHRRRGLFRAMTEMALSEYEHRGYAGYINLTSNQYSTPGELQLGWVNIATRKTLRKYGLTGLVKYFLIQKMHLGIKGFNLKQGRFGNIEITYKLKPEEMCSVLGHQDYKTDKIRLFRDVDFLRWKYRNNFKRYIFCYSWEDDLVTGYLVLGVTRYSPENTNKANIIDFAQLREGTIHKILGHITSESHSNIFDLWSYDTEDTLISDFKDHRFSEHDLILKIQKRLRGERYLLVRPIKKNYDEKDWFIHGFDMRDPANWEIGEVCAEAI